MKQFNKLKQLAITASAVVAFIMVAGAVSADTLGIDVASYQGTTTSYFSQFKSYGDKFTMVKLGG